MKLMTSFGEVTLPFPNNTMCGHGPSDTYCPECPVAMDMDVSTDADGTEEFPSGLVLKRFGDCLHFFGEMDIPFDSLFEEAKTEAVRISKDCGYYVDIPEENKIFMSGYESDDAFLLSFDINGLYDVVQMKERK